MSETRQNPKATASFLTRWLVRIVAHSLGVVVVALLLLLPYLNQATIEVITASAQHSAFLEMSAFEAVFHLSLAACLWALCVIGFEIVTSKRKPVAKLLRLQRGSVMTETLVILPVFFLLTFGIAQLAVNNIAGLLANAAVFQAGRTGWLWASEADAGRRGVTMTKAEELARVQAAAVLTPVAPAEFVQAGTTSLEFRQMRGILLGSQVPSFSQDTGAAAMTAAPALMAGTNMLNQSERDSTFGRAFDTSDFRQRTVRKFTFAYHATELTVTNGGDDVVTSLTYHHHQAFPIVGGIFGDVSLEIGGRPGYYTEIKREFSMPKQIMPNPRTP
jgi:hypothetical protein